MLSLSLLIRLYVN